MNFEKYYFINIFTLITFSFCIGLLIIYDYGIKDLATIFVIFEECYMLGEY